MLPIKSFLWLVECLPGLTPLGWGMILTDQAPQPPEGPLHVVETTGTVTLLLQIQLPLWEQCCSQAPLQLLGACCPLGSVGWASSCIRRSSEFKWFRHQLSANMNLSPGTAISPAVVGHCPIRWWPQLGALPCAQFFPSSSLSSLQSSPKFCHTFPRSRSWDIPGL